MKEKWKSARRLGFPIYAVSNKGRVKNTKFSTLKKNLTRAESFHHQGKQTQYEYLFLWRKGKRYYFSIHLLVALIHLESPKGPIKEYTPHHKDFDPSNNWATNLQWCTREEHRKIHKDDPDFESYDEEPPELPKSWNPPWDNQF